MALTKILNKLLGRKDQQVSDHIISEEEIKDFLYQFQDEINLGVLCEEMDISKPYLPILWVEEITLLSFTPGQIAKDRDKKPSTWRWMKNRLLGR